MRLTRVGMRGYRGQLVFIHMFGSFRKHQKWIWILGVIIIIPSFVVFFSPDARLKGGGGGGQATGNYGSVNGKPISLPAYRKSYQETRLSYFFRGNGKWPDNDEATSRNLERDTVFRILLIDKMNDLDIHVSDAAAARMAKERIGNYPLANFDKDFLAPHGVSLEDFERFLRHEAGIQQLVNVAASSAKLMNPSEAEVLWKKEHQDVQSSVAVFNYSNYLASVPVNPTNISTFYSNRMATYRIPERTVLAYIPFAATNFLVKADEQISKMTNFNALVDEEYIKRGTNAVVKTADGKVDEAASKKKIREEIREVFAMREARKAASDFGNELMDKAAKGPQTVQVFTNFAAEKGYKALLTPPFDRQEGLADTNFPSAFETKGLTLTTTEPISFSPILGEHAVFLIALDHKIPSELPAFDKIRDKVTADYKKQNAQDLARKAGNSFHIALTNGLAQKKTFEQVAKESNVKFTKLPPFSQVSQTVPEVEEAGANLQTLKRLAMDVNPGQSSPFIPTQEGGLVFYMDKRLPVDENKMKADMPEFLARLRLYRQNEAFNQWFRKQAEQAKITLPPHETKTASAQ